MNIIKVKFLGLSSININNKRIELPFLKAENILYLLLYEGIISRDVLCSLLWGDMDEQSAKKNLRNAIYVIRKHTFDDIITSPKRSLLKINDKYNIESDIEQITEFNPCDDNDISTIENFINCFDGDFLRELKSKSNSGFETRIEPISNRIKNLYIEKLKKLSNILVQYGDTLNIEFACRRLIELEEYEETGYRNLMKHFIHLKKYDEAINIYNSLEEKLDNDLSVRPSKETQQILNEIIKNNTKSKLSRESIEFYGREKEKELLYNNIYNFIGNRSFKSFLVCGEAGIGRTSLISEVLNSIDINILKVKITCYEYETGFIFKFWDKVFQQISITIKEEKLHIPRSLINSISRSFPTFDIYSNNDFEDNNSSQNYHLTEKAIFDLFNLISKKLKIVLVVDDLHFADKASLKLLYKTMLENRYKIMLIASYSEGYEDIDDKFYYNLKFSNAIDKIYLNRFSKNEIEEFIHLVMPKAISQTDKIFFESEGNPLFMIEMLNNIKNGIDEGYMSNKIENLIGSRLLNLSDQANKLVCICSMFHDVIYIETLIRITDIKGIDLIDIIDELLSKEILKEKIDKSNKSGLVFSHHKIREYIYTNISNSKRIVLHEKIAEYYENKIISEKITNRTLYPEMIYHFTYANNKLKVFKYKIKWMQAIFNASHEIFPIAEISDAVGLIEYYTDEKVLEKEFEEIKLLYEELACDKSDELIEDEIVFLYLYGRFNKGRGNSTYGLYYIDKMICISREKGYYEFAFEGYLQLIQYYVNVNNLNMMDCAIYNAEKIAKIIDDKIKIAIVLRFKGYFYILSGHYETGEQYLNKAFSIFNSSKSREKYILNMVASLFYLGESYKIQKKYDKSLEYYHKAFDLCDENEEFPAVALIFSRIGYIKYEQNLIDESQFYFLKSLKAYNKTIFAWGRAEVYYYLFIIYDNKNMKEKAQLYLNDALYYIDKYSSDDLKEKLKNYR